MQSCITKFIFHKKIYPLILILLLLASLRKSVMSHTVIGLCRTVGGGKRAGGEIVL